MCIDGSVGILELAAILEGRDCVEEDERNAVTESSSNSTSCKIGEGQKKGKEGGREGGREGEESGNNIYLQPHNFIVVFF